MERDVKIGKISKDQQTEQKVEILTALRKLGDQVRSPVLRACEWTTASVSTKQYLSLHPQISPEEAQFLEQHGSAALDEFERVSGEMGMSSTGLVSSSDTLLRKTWNKRKRVPEFTPCPLSSPQAQRRSGLLEPKSRTPKNSLRFTPFTLRPGPSESSRSLLKSAKKYKNFKKAVREKRLSATVAGNTIRCTEARPVPAARRQQVQRSALGPHTKKTFL
jgi:hypothetical protein